MKKNTKINFKIPFKEKIAIVVIVIVAIILSIIAIRSPEFNNGSSSIIPNDTSSDYELDQDEYDNSYNYDDSYDDINYDDGYEINEENTSDIYVPDGDN